MVPRAGTDLSSLPGWLPQHPVQSLVIHRHWVDTTSSNLVWGCECPGLSQRAEKARIDHPGRARAKRGGTLLQLTPPAMSSVQGVVAQSHGEGMKGSSVGEGSQLDQAVAVLTISVLAANAEEPLAEVTATHLSCHHTAQGT